MRLTAEIQISKNLSNAIPVTYYFPLSSLPTPFKVQRLYPYLVASVAMWMALALGKGRDEAYNCHTVVFKGNMPWGYSLFYP